MESTATAELAPAVTAPDAPEVDSDMPRLPPLMTTQDVATRLHVTTVTVCKYVKDGLLPALTLSRPWLITRDDYLKFRKEVWPLLSGGKQGHPVRGKGRAHVSPNLMDLIFAVRKLTGHK